MVTISNMNNVVIGDTLSIKITVKENGVPLDITGATITGTIKTSCGAATNLSQVTGTILDATNGVVELIFPKTDMANALVNTGYIWDSTAVLSNSREYTSNKGTVTYLCK